MMDHLRLSLKIYSGKIKVTNDHAYEYIIKECNKEIDVVQTGIFGAHMEVALINDGPFTVVLEDL